ncbi:MAG TPA: carboxypeptidase-like regulatory domain-containing protein [Gemmataceae bacterium]|jgi:hypothetical protein
MLAWRWLIRTAGFAALVTVLGCSQGDANLATVSGEVTQNGTPVEGAKITFHSTVEVEGKKGHSYSATTDSSGKYLLASVGKERGIPPGMYKVTITKLDMKSANLPPDFDQGQLEASGMGRNTMPKDYELVATTKLSVTLESGKNKDKNFDLKGTASSGSRPVTVP